MSSPSKTGSGLPSLSGVPQEDRLTPPPRASVSWDQGPAAGGSVARAPTTRMSTGSSHGTTLESPRGSWSLLPGSPPGSRAGSARSPFNRKPSLKRTVPPASGAPEVQTPTTTARRVPIGQMIGSRGLGGDRIGSVSPRRERRLSFRSNPSQSGCKGPKRIFTILFDGDLASGYRRTGSSERTCHTAGSREEMARGGWRAGGWFVR